MNTISASPAQGSRIGFFQIALLFLSILLLATLAVDSFFVIPKEVSKVIDYFDSVVCVFFLIDFFVRLAKAESKWCFLKWGWIDLIASIPNVEFLRWGRMVRVLRVIRLLRTLRSLHRIFRMILGNKYETGVVSLGLTFLLLIVFSSISILIFEQQGNSNIRTSEDAIWWSISTVTTVGYGDKYPVTTEGRIVGIFLMIAGVGMFAGISGIVSSLFLGSHYHAKTELVEIKAQLAQMQETMENIQKQRPE